MHKYNHSLKINKVGKDFLERLIRNRIKADTDLTELSRGKTIELFFLYFKRYEEDYKKLLNLEYKENG